MCSGKCLIKAFLNLVNVILFLAGGLLLAFGVTAMVRPSMVTDLLSKIPNMDKIPAAINLAGIINGCAVFMIVLGAIVAAISLFGLIGACCEVKCMLVLYFVILIIIMLAQIALIIFAAVFPVQMKSTMQGLMLQALNSNFTNDVTLNATTSTFTLPTDPDSLGWTALQFGTACCGAFSYLDYNTTIWYKSQIPVGSKRVPLSCCVLNDTKQDLTTLTSASFKDLGGCQSGTNLLAINQHNCYDTIVVTLATYGKIAIGIAAGIVGLELILIILSICLFRMLQTKGSDKYV